MAVYPTFPGGKRKVATFSYDDGGNTDKIMIDMMNKYGIKGTFNLCSGDVLFSEVENPKEVYKGHEVAVHGLTHVYIDRVQPQTATYEIIKDRENLEKVFGGAVRGFAYPYTAYNDASVPLLKNCGLKYARTASCTENFRMPSDWYYWHPTVCDTNPKYLEICERFVTAKNAAFNQSQMLYVYGHSHITDRRDLWGTFEESLKMLSEHDDIWFATNIEICDYYNAFLNLVMSVDSKYIYNPTNTTLSLIHSNGDFINGSVTFEIKPGEEIYLDRV